MGKGKGKRAAPQKSLEQQREDALKWQAENCHLDEDEEEEDEDDMDGCEAQSVGAAAPAVPAMAAVKLDPVAAAKAEAKREVKAATKTMK